MADNVAITAGAGTSVAADDVGGVMHQRIKLSLGADGVAADAASGAGVVDATVLRVTLATDDPLIAIASAPDAQLPPALGSTTSAGSVSFTLASDEPVIKAEDAVHASGDKGIMALAVRKDTAATLAGTDGDYTPAIVNARAATWVAIEDGAGGQVTSFGGGGSVSAAPAGITANGNLFAVDMANYNGISVQILGVGGGCTVNYEQSEDQTTWFAIQGVNASGAPTTVISSSTTASVFAFPKKCRYFRARVSAYSSGTVSCAYTLTNSSEYSFLYATIQNSSIAVVGAAAHDAAILLAPARIAGRGRNFGLPYTAVAVDDVADLVTNLIGHLKVTQEYSFANLAATNGAGAAVKASAGVLHTVSVNKPVASAVLSLYDAASATNPIAVIDASIALSRTFDAVFATGLYWVLSGANADVTVTYN